MKKLLTLFTALLFLGGLMSVQADYYVAGINEDWSAANSDYKMSGSDPASLTKQMASGTYRFKITNGTWSNSWGNYDQSASNVTLSNDGGNIKFTLSTTSDVTFYFNPSTSKAYVQAEAVVVPSYTFTSGTIIYYDFTGYKNGINVYAPGSPTDWYESSAEIISVTLSSDWEITASTNLFKSAASSWNFVKGTTLPTEGQNMIVSSDGVNYTWGTYVPTPDVYTVVGTVPGLNWDQTSSTNDMTKNDNVYTLVMENVELAVNTYEYKMVKNHAWTTSYPSGSSNASFSITTAGIYNLTFTLDLSASPEYSVTPTLIQPTVVIPAVKMYGTFADGSTWGDTQEFTLAGNNETASLTLENLPAGNYQFKVVVGSSYRGNGYTLYRDYVGAANIGTGDNMTLEADVTGNYTFTWTYENDSLGIDFPAEPTPEYATIKFFAPRDETNKWEHVYAYSYKGSRKFLGVWPGTEITSTKDAGWYTVSVRKGSNLIFTDDDGMQTNDIMDIQADACYESTSIYYPTNPEEAKKVTVTANTNCAVAYYIAGSKTLIGGTADFDTNVALDENNQKVFKDVEPGTYAFKINNNTWAWSIGGIDHMKAGDCASIAQEVGTGDLGFKIETKQDVTVTYYPETQEICLGAVTVKATTTVEAADMSVKAGESQKITYTTNNTENPNVTYTVVSGSEYLGLFKGVITGIKPGEAVVRVSLAETDNYTAASDELTITVSNPVVPAKAIEAVGGKFIINAKGDTAVFSRGNLKYNVATSQWYCAEKQYDFVGEGGNLHFGDADYTGEFDLFGWSCTSSNYGLLQSNHDEDYTGEFIDWGGLFAGGEQEWSSLTGSEMTYIIQHHKWTTLVLDPTPADADNEDEIYGIALFPLNWVMPAGFEGLHYSLCDWYEEAKFEDNTIALSDWSTLEAAGAVYLPMAGARAGHWGNTWNGKAEDSRRNPNPNGGNSYCFVDNIRWYGYYWSSTTDPRANHPYDAQYLIFPGWSEGPTLADEDDLYLPPVVWSREKRRGNSVRLVTRIPREEVVIRDGLSDGKWGTICPKQNVEYVNGASFYQISYLEEQNGLPFNMIFDEISGNTLTAGQPYFFIASAEAIKGSKVGNELTVAGDGINGFYGYIGTTSWELPYVADYNEYSNNTFVIYNNSVFRINQPGTMLKSERCYININATEPTRSMSSPLPSRRRVTLNIHNTNVATGMEEITNDQSPITTKILIDGQLFILRNDQLFDATGRLVK